MGQGGPVEGGPAGGDGSRKHRCERGLLDRRSQLDGYFCSYRGDMSDFRELLTYSASLIADYREAVAERPVFPEVDFVDARANIGSLQNDSISARAVVDELVGVVEPMLVGNTGPRYFGFVVGGALDAATAADMLTVGWDQNAFNTVMSPGAAVIEEIAGGWIKELLGLPLQASFGFATGGQGANTVSLAAARHFVLNKVGWDVEKDGLFGAPRVRVVVTGERHATIDTALRVLGFGSNVAEPVLVNSQGAIDISDLTRVLERGMQGPVIVCLQAGNVNTGAFDDFVRAIPIAHQHNAWVHVDGAFGLWAAANPATRYLLEGVEQADSWATDGHKWLNVPYDCGYAFCAHPDAHRGATSYSAPYLKGQEEDEIRAPGDYVLESSRRARGFATWAALRQLGRTGIADLVEGCCALARRFADQLASVEGVTVLNDVVLNQVLVRFGDDLQTDRVIRAVQRSGECWMGATTWQGKRAMRISVSNWQTTEADVDRSVTAILDALSAK